MGAGNPIPAYCSRKINLPSSGEKVPRAPSRPRAPKATPIYGSLPSDGRFRTWNCPKGAFKSSSIMPIAILPWCAYEQHNLHGHQPHAPPARSGDLTSQDAFRPLGFPAEQVKPNRFTGTSSGSHQPEDAIDLRLHGRDAAAAPHFHGSCLRGAVAWLLLHLWQDRRIYNPAVQHFISPPLRVAA